MPLLFPLNPRNGDYINPAPEFLPLDLVSYNLEVRPTGPLMNTSGIITEAKVRVTQRETIKCHIFADLKLRLNRLMISWRGISVMIRVT